MKISREWTMQERLQIIDLLAAKISREGMPVVSATDYNLLDWISMLCTQYPEFLEKNRSKIFEAMGQRDEWKDVKFESSFDILSPE